MGDIELSRWDRFANMTIEADEADLHVAHDLASAVADSAAADTFRVEHQSSAGPDWILFLGALAPGSTLLGIAAVMNAWSGRHKEHHVRVKVDEREFELTGQKLTREQTQDLIELLSLTVGAEPDEQHLLVADAMKKFDHGEDGQQNPRQE